MLRRRLWEVSCSAKDAVLWTSFTWEELRQLAERSFFPLDYPPAGARADASVFVVSAVHKACDERNAYSERVDRLLEDLHGDSALVVATTPADEAADWIGAELSSLPVPLPGLIWAVVSDPRPEMRAVEGGLLWRLHTEGLRRIAFGKIELVAI